MDDLESLENALMQMNRRKVMEIAASLTQNENDRFDEVIMRAMDRIGEKWEQGKLALSQVYMSGILCEEALKLWTDTETVEVKDYGLGIVVFEDQHVLGKKIVKNYIEAKGIACKDLGQGKGIHEILSLVNKFEIKVLLVSTLMLPAAVRVGELRKALDRDVKMIVGGAPFRIDQNLWKEVGADGFASTASGIGVVLKEVLGDDY